MTCFEDLSNELLYDLFEFLDTCEVLEIFPSLNDRFHRLITGSSIPLHFNFSGMTRSMFHRYCEGSVAPNTHRITALTFPHQLSVDHFWTQFALDSFAQLRSLVLNDMTYSKSVDLLDSFVQLPCLSSISIAIWHGCSNASSLYQSLLRLPKLKYCKVMLVYLSAVDVSQLGQLTSSIEHLVIINTTRLSAVVSVLNCTPQLRRFSYQSINPSLSAHEPPPETFVVPSQLTHVSLEDVRLSFDDFDSFMTRISSRLRNLSITVRNDPDFLDADRWQLLIADHIPHLKMFDFQHWFPFSNDMPENHTIYHTMTIGFTSAFWSERNWSFAHEEYAGQMGPVFFFYSIPSKR